MTIGRERAREMAADESCSSGDCDLHGCPLSIYLIQSGWLAASTYTTGKNANTAFNA